MMRTRWSLLAFSFLLPAVAQNPERQTRNPEAPPETRQFEFMLGRWSGVSNSVDASGNRSTFEILWEGQYVLDGWAIRTDWRIPLPGGKINRGTMIRAFDPAAKEWNIAEFYTPGLALHTFRARQEGSTMVQRSEEGGVLTRGTFYNITPDRYENRQEISRDGGKTWVQRSHSVVTRLP
ncbi:MAG: hypothetical protein K2X35_01800 [Bryobacteraceae bacterium]|nr:hypothetical protein [Bryobacteraceae bacterium]